ncbi:MAG: hypothetical protein U9Q73_00370 [Nanoarchaeota archaeon]|nr:hypothetical protein [Nanoarchaeota archaeon]
MTKKKKCNTGYERIGSKCVKKDSYGSCHTVSSSRNFYTEGGGIGFFGLLTILFIGLKLGKVIDWSWWWVLAPIWCPMALGLVIIFIMWMLFN